LALVVWKSANADFLVVVEWQYCDT